MSKHPAVDHLLPFFDYEHLPPRLAEISSWCHDLAHKVAGEDSPLEGPELTAGLQ